MSLPRNRRRWHETPAFCRYYKPVWRAYYRAFFGNFTEISTIVRGGAVGKFHYDSSLGAIEPYYVILFFVRREIYDYFAFFYRNFDYSSEFIVGKIMFRVVVVEGEDIFTVYRNRKTDSLFVPVKYRKR